MVSLSILIDILRLYSFERIPDVLHSIIPSFLKLKQKNNSNIIKLSLVCYWRFHLKNKQFLMCCLIQSQNICKSSHLTMQSSMTTL